MNFNIHNLLKFRIDGTNKAYLKYFSQDYSYFQTNEPIDSDLDVIVSDFTPSNNDCYIINHRYYVKENYLFCKDRYKIVRWSLCIKDIEDKPTVYFKGGVLGKTFLKDYIVEPLIGFKLAQKGYSLLHASGVTFNSKGFVFPSCKGVGKTSTILNLIETSDSFLGDESIILSNDSMVYSFPSYIHFYHYNLKSSPQISEKLGIKDKFELQLKHLIYVLSLKYASFSLDIDSKELFKEIGNKSRLQSLILLTKTNRDAINILENIDRKGLVKRLVLINKYQMQYFSDLLLAYSYICPESAVNSYWQTLENNLSNALAKVSCHEVEIPLNYDSKVYEKIYELLK